MRKVYLLSLTSAFLVLSLAVSAQPAELKVHYLFDETDGTVAADASGNGFDGTVTNATWTEGTLGGALQLPGDASNVTLPAEAIGMNSDFGSVSFWINCDVPSSIYTIFWAGDNTTGGGFGAENEMHIHLESAGDSWSGGELSFFIIANPNTFLFTDPAKGTDPAAAPVSPTLVGDLQWHHVAATWGNGTVVQLFLDGQKVSETAYTSTSYDLSNIYIGQMANASRLYAGKIDDFRLFTGILNLVEISNLYMKITNVDKFTSNNNNLSCYPNPAIGNLNVDFMSNAGNLAEISLVNLVGQQVVTNSVHTTTGANNTTLSLDGVAPGMYFIQLELDNEVTIGKILVK